MSELKVYHCNEWHNEYTEFYMKDEADKVIEEKDEIIDELKEHIDELQKATDSAWSKVNAIYDELRHQKYKRCVAMADKCAETEKRYYYLICLDGSNNPKYDRFPKKRWTYGISGTSVGSHLPKNPRGQSSCN